MNIKSFLLVTISLTAQRAIAQTQPEVVAAELAFANTARTQTMKKAFLGNMDSTAVVFEGATMYNGFAFWNKAPETNGKLLWHPMFFGSSRANDLGFTTGPWEYRATLEDSIAGSGQYTTIWKKNNKGEWKFLIDLGVYYRGSLLQDQSLRSCASLISANEGDTSILLTEKKFLEEYTGDKQNAFRHFLHQDSWLNTNGRHPVQTSAAILPELARLPAETTFEPIASGMSSSRDLAYVYGTIQYSNKKENYLRVWGYTGEGWRILLQVIK